MHTTSHRIALIVPRFPAGSETFIVNHVLELERTGWDVQVVCNTIDLPHLSSLGLGHIARRVHVAWHSHFKVVAALLLPVAMFSCLIKNFTGTARYLLRGCARLGWNLPQRFYLDAPVIALRPAIVHFEFGALAAERADLGQLLGCRVVVSFRGYDLNMVGIESPDYYSQVWKSADWLHFLGQDLREKAFRRGCPAGKQHSLVPPAIDADCFRQRAARPVESVTSTRPLRLLSIGRLHWNKGYEFGLSAVRRVIDAGIPCEYRILGAGDYQEAIAFCAHQLGLTRSLALLGACSRAEVLAQMEWADLLIHPAVSEGFCNAVLEAQAMELPVVASDAGGLPENVVDGVTGFIVPRRDPEAMAARIVQLARDPELRRRMGEAGRARVLENFRLEQQTAAFNAMYQSVLQSNGPAVAATTHV